ncbi:hypothetical protein D9619_002372 [Psilocybe cf. subviscida]|uniref:AB hydrolase-1 domain-containing protein n=1 Tax=Psilocybe cf. subviscida TaxID=2480587 RepID=A0A8H5AWT4_9AGAR|nr:hypothetical protein D9619_002372 [Psilocybe cf. subviscida]
MNIQSFVLNSPRGPDGLKMTAKRYRPTGARGRHGEETIHRGDGRTLTLLLAHCVGSHKEQWEPTIEHLFQLERENPGADTKASSIIREAWSIDWQNHGDGAVVNRKTLQSPERAPGVSLYEWADALSDLAVKLATGEMDGERHKLVAIGHSAGATAFTLSAHTLLPSLFYPLTDQPFAKRMHPYSALILTEPTLVTHKTFHITEQEHEARMDEMRFAVGMTKKRKWKWRSWTEARRYFGLPQNGEAGDGQDGRLPWAMWDQEVVRRLVEYGLESDNDSSAKTGDDSSITEERRDGPVRLKCHPEQEAASYPNTAPHHEGAEYLADIVKAQVPVHLVWGTRCDLVPEFIQDSLSDASEGRNVASVTKMEDAGHMVVQEQPKELAVALMKILQTVFTDETEDWRRRTLTSTITTKL